MFIFSLHIAITNLGNAEQLIAKEKLEDGSSEEILSSPTYVVTPTVKVIPTVIITKNSAVTNSDPCVNLPVFTYHHIQDKTPAYKNRQIALTVYTDVFRQQMEYLRDNGFKVISMEDLINFFDNGVMLPNKSLLLTFDDAYNDFFTNAYPVLKSLNFKATVFTPTELINNSNYLNWEDIQEMSKNGIYFANHTSSHKDVASVNVNMKEEISKADSQLTEQNLNKNKIFAYPYGSDSSFAETYLSDLGYKVAFTTKPGTRLCRSKRFSLPRVRIGNLPLSYYGY
jgi:Predicted xylanase/chitin deacetylase